MRFAAEVVVEDVLPTLRAMLAEQLAAQGLPQDAVARALGLSQAAVSKYQTGKVRVNPAIAREARVKRVVAEVASGLAQGALGPFDALARLELLLRELEHRGPVCRLHEAQMPALRGLGCDLCVAGQGSEVVQDMAVLANVRLAVRTLTQARGVAALLPAVGSNIAMARPGARDARDVAALPGRIDEVLGAVKVPGPPEFGASRHVAEVVLGVLQHHPERRAAMNLRNGKDVQRAARKLGLRLATFDARDEGRREGIARAVRGKAPDVLHHEGAFGVEPVLYLLGADAAQVARTAAQLAQALP
ncbi:MAG: transcriptional regulator [Halobacteriales archaeon]|nr:transcriptional regulator [Halobacteriales archaeon]